MGNCLGGMKCHQAILFFPEIFVVLAFDEEKMRRVGII